MPAVSRIMRVRIAAGHLGEIHLPFSVGRNSRGASVMLCSLRQQLEELHFVSPFSLP